MNSGFRCVVAIAAMSVAAAAQHEIRSAPAPEPVPRIVGSDGVGARLATLLSLSHVCTPFLAPGDLYLDPIPNSSIVHVLGATEAAPDGALAFLHYSTDKQGVESCVVSGRGFPEGVYEVALTGGVQAELLIAADGDGDVSMPAPKGGFADLFSGFPGSVSLSRDDELLASALLPSVEGEVLLDDPGSIRMATRLVATGPDLDAHGVFRFRYAPGLEGAQIKLSHLAPGEYLVDVGGGTPTVVHVDPDGRARVDYRVPLKPGHRLLPLAFTVPGKWVRVMSLDGTVLLEGRMPADSTGHDVKHRLGLQRFKRVGKGGDDGLRFDFVRGTHTGFDLHRGTGTLLRRADGNASFTIKLTGQDFLPSTPYPFLVDQVQVGVVGDGFSLEKVFGTDDDADAAFDFDVIGKRLDLMYGTKTSLSAVFPRSLPAALGRYRRDKLAENRWRVDLHNPGTDFDATGRAAWRTNAAGLERLTLQVTDLTAGLYDLRLDGELAAAAALEVLHDGGGAKAVFVSAGAGGKLLPLDFEVNGLLEITATGTTSPVFLQRTLPALGDG